MSEPSPPTLEAKRRPPVRPRLGPTQKRSRERFERILDCAVEILEEKGSDGFRMTDVVERSGVAYGSLYQYFPDRSAIFGTLAERYNQLGRACVQQALADVRVEADLHVALARIVDGYHRMFLDHPVMTDLWTATQADRALQSLDEAEGIVLAARLEEAVVRVAAIAPTPSLTGLCQLLMTLIAAAVRHAIALEPAEAERSLRLFKTMLPSDLAAACR